MDKPSFKKEMANVITKRQVKYVTERISSVNNPSGSEEVICHAGRANIKDDCLLITSGENDIFKGKISELKFSELFSKEGCIIQGNDLFHDGKNRTIIVYYTYYL